MVYLACDASEREFAVKVMNGSSPSVVKEIEREIKLLKMLKPLEEAGGSSKTMTTIEQMKINTMARIYEMCFDAAALKPEVCEAIRESVAQEGEYWRARWCVRLRGAIIGACAWYE